MTKEIYECQNCDWTGSYEELKDIVGYDERVEPGEPEPTGECPKCGALCHEKEEEEGQGRTFSFDLGPWDITANSFEEAKRFLLEDLAEFVTEEHLTDDPEALANARLIAAAPDMLAALETLLEHEGKREVSGIGTEHDSDALEVAKGAARAAINKAKGA